MPKTYDRAKQKEYTTSYVQRLGYASPAEYQKALRAEYRDKVIEALGCKCVHCGFSDKRALQVDHKNGDGYGVRKHKGSATHWKNVLGEIEAGSDRYQLLCANCNWIKRHNNGEYRAH
jgi:hypothetical protein